ncbi:MAG: polysaccharide deacetylase family protein [Defluviitaleaceae bacterium]|nr:polysaccharide deacetylase family protein [Defluviitaleaceae bacterium]
MKKSRNLLMFLIIFLQISTAQIAASPLETLLGSAQGDTQDVLIIMYHALEDTPDNIWEITTADFESDLKYLAANGFNTVIMQDLIDFVYHGKPLPENPIVLSFDDGRSPTIDILLPLLEQYNAQITMAIIGIETDKYTEIEKQKGKGRHPHMTWGDVQNAANSGRVEIQSHTYDLHGSRGIGKKSGESDEAHAARLLADLEKFALVLEQNAGLTANSLTYPLGVFTDTSDDIIKQAGYLASMTCREKTNTLVVGNPESLFSLNRYLRPPRKSSEQFFSKILENQEMAAE